MIFRTILCVLIFMGCIHVINAQIDSVFVNNSTQMGKLYKHSPNGIPNWNYPHVRTINHPTTGVHDPLMPINSSSPHFTLSMKTSQATGTQVQVGRNFEGNHLYGSIPSDNALAISDGGIIVSLDNATIAYFKENGDSTVKFGLPHAAWYQDTTMGRGIFDPKLVYDRQNDRFIAVLLYVSQDYSDSRLLVSFSTPLISDSVSWNHYQISTDSIYTLAGQGLYWLDYPTIAINEDELFVGLNVFNHDNASGNDAYEETLFLQIEKQGGYNGAAQLTCKEWKDVKNASGQDAGVLVPVGDAFQSPGYDNGCFLLSNYFTGSSNFFWYELTGGVNDANATLVSHLTATSFFYSFPSFATQMGGNGGDRIRFGDCRIHGGIYQNGKLHFVMHRSDNGWGEIVYGRITIANNSFFQSTWGGAEESLNSMYPSIAPYGSDTTEETFMIAFQRTGPTIFPELCVINFDSTWSPGPTVIKQGEGVLDQKVDLLAPWDSLERIGDYTSIQRRFSDPNNACWIGGSFAAGQIPNHFGVIDGLKTWIAEVGDSMLVAIPKTQSPKKFYMFPNPANASTRNLNFQLPVAHDAGRIRIVNSLGELVIDTNYSGPTFSIQIPNFATGLYFVSLSSPKFHYATQKYLIHR